MKRITSKTVQRAARRLWLAAVTVTTAICLPCAASASTWQTSPIATGTQKLINDITTWLVVICPLVGGLAALYFFIRRSIADEQDGKLWTRRIFTAIICGVAGALVSGLISLITSYYT